MARTYPRPQQRVITVALVRRANRAAIEGKRYATHIEEAASRLPRLTAKEINRAWARTNGKTA